MAVRTILIAALMFAFCGILLSQSKPTSPELKESVVFSNVDGPNYHSFIASPDARHFGYVLTKDQKMYYCINGKPVYAFKVMVDDTKNLATVISDKHFMLRDGTQGIIDGRIVEELCPKYSVDSGFETYDNGWRKLTPNSEGKFIYISRPRGGRQEVRRDGVPVAAIDSKYFDASFIVSQGANSIAMLVNDVVYLNGKELFNSPNYRVSARNCGFSPDGKKFYYTYLSGEKAFMVIDGKTMPSMRWIFQVTFSPNSQHYMALGTNDSGQSVRILDGKMAGDELGYGYHLTDTGKASLCQPVYSKDKKYFAYLEYSTDSVVISDAAGAEVKIPNSVESGGRLGRVYGEDTFLLTMSPSAKHVGVTIKFAGESSSFQGIFVDGKKVGDNYSKILAIDFSDDATLNFIGIKDNNLYSGTITVPPGDVKTMKITTSGPSSRPAPPPMTMPTSQTTFPE